MYHDITGLIKDVSINCFLDGYLNTQVRDYLKKI